MRENTDEAPSPWEGAADTAPLPALRVLVVDDNDDIRTVLVQMLERLGHGVTTAVDGLEAVERLAAEDFDLLLLDLSMPRMSGEDVLRWLQDRPELAEGMRVVVVSALAGQRQDRLEELGAHAVLPKPFRARQLRQLIASQAPMAGR